MKRRMFGKPQALSFGERVVLIAQSIPKGSVTTYGRISKAAGGTGMSAQSITSILARAYDRGAHDIPFHRIVYADGRVWIDEPTKKKRMKLYKDEDIKLDQHNRVINFFDRLYLSEY